MGLLRNLCVLCIIGGNLLSHPTIDWLESQSMLHQSKRLAKEFSAKKLQWQRPYGFPKPLEAIDLAENWFTSYPKSLMTDHSSTLGFLGTEELWDTLQDIGLNALHTGPMQIAGALHFEGRTPSIDGGFDRISLHLDPEYGTYQEYMKMVETAKKHQSIIIGDLVPAHSGIGADFFLALKNYQEYPGIYHMVEVHPKDWPLLPKVEKGISANLSMKQVDQLKKKGYIVGQLDTQIFFHPKVKTSNWSASKKIRGVDGKQRRWVYLHYFKAAQPSYNWLDPSFSAQKIVAGDILFCLFLLKNSILRLDANSFLGVETVENTKKAWSESHPVAREASNTLAMMIRKFGGYSFQELNLGPKSLKSFSEYGADLSYDFITRASYVNALMHENTDLLKISYDVLSKYKIDLRTLIHAMQNHDEHNYELKHLKELGSEIFSYHGEDFRGIDLRKKIQEEDIKALGEKPFYNAHSGEGICSTMVGICAAALGIADVYNMSAEEKKLVKKAHLLLTFFNVMQPGVFAISPWDLVGALPLEKQQYEHLSEKDHDERWRLRGSIELLNCNKSARSSTIPQAKTLYGPVKKQLKNKSSYASLLKELLLARKSSHIAKATFLGYFPTKNPALFVFASKLPATGALQITALNFSKKPIKEKITLPGAKKTSAINLLTRKTEPKEFDSETISLQLNALEAKAVVLQKSPAPIEKKSTL